MDERQLQPSEHLKAIQEQLVGFLEEIIYTGGELHLFFDCQSSIARWQALGIQWLQQGDIVQKLQHQKSTFQGPYFMDLFMLATWSIWKERNDFIFNGRPPSLSKWKQLFKSEVVLHLHRLPAYKHSLIMNWTQAL